MNIEVLTPVVIGITQVIKEWIKAQFPKIWKPWMGVALSLLVSAGVVFWFAEPPITWGILGTIVAVFALANGFKNIKKLTSLLKKK